MRGRPCSCAFTGHRPGKLPWGEDESDLRCIALKAKLRAAVESAIHEGMEHFICGMAEGCDLYFAETVLALKSTYPHITLEAAIPCPSQADGWGERGIILAADEQQRHHSDERTRRVADRRRDGQLNVAEAEIAERHRADVQQRHGQIGPDNRPADLRAADENFERSVKTHHGTDGNDHLEVSEVIVLSLTANLGKQVAAAPAEQRDQRKPEPHIELLNSFVLLFFR